MKLILEEGDIISLLGKALEMPLTPDDVHIQADPFQVTINQAERSLKEVKIVEDTAMSPSKPDVQKAFRPPRDDDDDNSIEDLMRTSQSMVQEGTNVNRTLRGNESQSPPGPTVGGLEQKD